MKRQPLHSVPTGSYVETLMGGVVRVTDDYFFRLDGRYVRAESDHRVRAPFRATVDKDGTLRFDEEDALVVIVANYEGDPC